VLISETASIAEGPPLVAVEQRAEQMEVFWKVISRVHFGQAYFAYVSAGTVY